MELRDSKVDLVNLTRVQELLSWLSEDSQVSQPDYLSHVITLDQTQATCLSYTGRLEDPELQQELLTNAKAAFKACDQIYMFTGENSATTSQLRSVIESVKNLELEPTVNICRGESGASTELSYRWRQITSSFVNFRSDFSLNLNINFATKKPKLIFRSSRTSFTSLW